MQTAEQSEEGLGVTGTDVGQKATMQLIVFFTIQALVLCVWNGLFGQHAHGYI